MYVCPGVWVSVRVWWNVEQCQPCSASTIYHWICVANVTSRSKIKEISIHIFLVLFRCFFRCLPHRSFFLYLVEMSIGVRGRTFIYLLLVHIYACNRIIHRHTDMKRKNTVSTNGKSNKKMLAALRLFPMYGKNRNEIEFWKREEKPHTHTVRRPNWIVKRCWRNPSCFQMSIDQWKSFQNQSISTHALFDLLLWLLLFFTAVWPLLPWLLLRYYINIICWLT